ncbi:MAG: hypothetical protein ACK5IN_08735, partial [Microbacterium sp.]
YLMAHAAIRALNERLRTGRSSSAALSLARTARLLTNTGTSEPDIPIRADNRHDTAQSVEHTSWGPARRLRAPLTIDGVDIRTALPARDLGSDPAVW